MPTNANFFLTLQESFKKAGSKACIDGPDFPRLTYSELEELSAQASNLLSSLGLKAGSRVVVQAPKSPTLLALYLACMRSGVIYVPLNNAYTHDELDYFIQDTTPSLFVCSTDSKDELTELFIKHSIPSTLDLDEQGGGSLYDCFKDLPSEHEPVQVDSDDVAVIIYTSGTTGKSKGAMLTHSNLSSNALNLYELWHWQEDDVLIHALPVFHVHGLFVALHLALLGGSTMLFLSRFDVKQTLELIPQATVLMGVPTFYTRLLQEPALTPEYCKNMRLFVSGSAPLLAETFTSFEERSGLRILERYGMSETGMLISNPYAGERLPGTVGYALPGVSYRVCGSDGEELEAGSIGTLQVQGPNVFNGYWRNPEKTREEFSDGFFITGDLVKEENDGRISIVGRNKDLIISGGFNVYPKEVELALDELEGVLESAVVGVPHPDFGEAVIGVIVPIKDQNPDADALIGLMKERLASYKVPKRIISMSELPRNTMGKVQKNLLREEFAGLFS